MTMVMLTLMMLTDWAASGDINGDDNFGVDKGNDVADVGSGEYFDARDVDDSEDNYGD
jgi:hypothetical protein